MKPRQLFFSGLLFALAPVARCQFIVTESNNYAEARYGIANSYSDVLQSQTGTALGGGTSSAFAEGNFTFSGRVTNHFGTTALTTSNQGTGLLGNFSAYARAIYLGGSYPYLASATVCSFSNTVRFGVSASGSYRISMGGTTNVYHSSTDRAPGSFFYFLTLDSSVTGSMINLTSASNSSSLSNVPYSQVVSLSPGVTYTATWWGGCNGVAISEPFFGTPGSVGETGYAGSLSITPVSTTVTQLSGTVNFLGWVGGNRPYTVELRDPSTNAVLQSANFMSIGSTGSFAFSTAAVTPSNAKLTVKPLGALRSSAIVTLGGAAQSVNFTVRPGDVDGSGEVDAADIDMVISNFGSFGGASDVDGSGEVDAADIDIVISRFGGVDE